MATSEKHLRALTTSRYYKSKPIQHPQKMGPKLLELILQFKAKQFCQDCHPIATNRFGGVVGWNQINQSNGKSNK